MRGGKEAFRSSSETVKAMRSGLERVGFDPDFVNIVTDISRNSANELMTRWAMSIFSFRGAARG